MFLQLCQKDNILDAFSRAWNINVNEWQYIVDLIVVTSSVRMNRTDCINALFQPVLLCMSPQPICQTQRAALKIFFISLLIKLCYY